jgi:hypothetical protein
VAREVPHGRADPAAQEGGELNGRGSGAEAHDTGILAPAPGSLGGPDRAVP